MSLPAVGMLNGTATSFRILIPYANDVEGFIITGEDKVFGVYSGPSGANIYIGGSPANEASFQGSFNLAISALGSALFNVTTGEYNIGIGPCLTNILDGDENVAIGRDVGQGIQSGNFNVLVGSNAGADYTASDSSNICILNEGSTGESNTIRIGTQGSSNKEQNRCFISGIVGVSPSNAVPVTIDSTTGQLGVGTSGTTSVSSIASGSAISLSTTIATDITSISLAAGIWQISALFQFGGAPTVTGPQQASISTTSATHGTLGDNSAQAVWNTGNFSLGNVPLTIPGYILTLGSTTTVYMVASGVFGAGSMTAYGRISATKLA